MPIMSQTSPNALGMSQVECSIASLYLDQRVEMDMDISAESLARVCQELKNEADELEQRALQAVEFDVGRAAEIHEDYERVKEQLDRFLVYARRRHTP